MQIRALRVYEILYVCNHTTVLYQHRVQWYKKKTEVSIDYFYVSQNKAYKVFIYLFICFVFLPFLYVRMFFFFCLRVPFHYYTSANRLKQEQTVQLQVKVNALIFKKIDYISMTLFLLIFTAIYNQSQTCVLLDLI